MALQIVIDGYNVIGSEQGLRGDLEAKRAALLRELKQYQAQKNHGITVVFDGWREGRLEQVEQQVGSVKVLFSRYGEKADLVIQRLAQETGAGCVVVTSDRELRRSVETAGAVAIFVRDFLRKLRQPDALESEPFGSDDMPVRHPRRGNPRKLSRAERLRRERLKKL